MSKEKIAWTAEAKAHAAAVMSFVAFAGLGCELKGYGIIRDFADGSNDTIVDETPPSTETGAEEEGPDSETRGVTGDSEPVENPTDPTADTVTGEDSASLDAADSEETCLCVCPCTGDTESLQDTEPEIVPDTGAVDADTITPPSTDGVDIPTDADGEPDCLVISEYVEGSSMNKAVELFNCGARALDLSAYSLCLVSNDNTDCGTTLPLSGALDAKEVLTICHTSAKAVPSCDIRSGVANFSGDDRLVLYTDQGVVDAFGTPDARPEGAPFADVTLRRCNLDPYVGDGPFVVEDYYTVHEKDDFADLGLAPVETDCTPE